MNKAIQYREDGKFYGLVNVPNPEHFKDDGVSSWNRERYLRYMEACIAAGKEIINPDVLPMTLGYKHQLNVGVLVHNDSGKKIEWHNIGWGDMFPCPDNIEFEEEWKDPCQTECDKEKELDMVCIYHCEKSKEVIRLKLKQEVKPVETQDELTLDGYLGLIGADRNHAAAMTIWRTLQEHKFTITRNKNGNE